MLHFSIEMTDRQKEEPPLFKHQVPEEEDSEVGGRYLRAPRFSRRLVNMANFFSDVNLKHEELAAKGVYFLMILEGWRAGYKVINAVLHENPGNFGLGIVSLGIAFYGMDKVNSYRSRLAKVIEDEAKDALKS